MDAAATPSKRAKTSTTDTPQKPRKAAAALFADQAATTPEKPPPPQKAGPLPPAAAAGLTWTPEKTEERRPLLRRASGKGAVALSVKEVRRAALELRRPDKGRAKVEKEDALESVAKELGVGAGAGRSPVKRRPEVKLPQSYEMLCEFFNCFESSTRLLRMKGSKATFPNICASIQNLADRRFTYGNLAQLKYIMPEAIVINKILLRDEKTCCMKPDLQVNLLVDAVKGSTMQKGETRYSALRRMFRQRVVDFFRNHPEGDDIPEHELPHPFTQTKPTVPQITPRVGVPEAESAVPSSSLAGLPPVGMSHMPGSFKRMFSKRSATCPATASTTSPLAKAESMSSSPLRKKIGASEGTPAKFASTPVRLMAATPGLHTPKQPVISATLCDTPPLTTTKRSARAKLFMTPTKSASSTTEEEENQITSTSAVENGDDELLSFLPKSLLQSVKQKEKRALEEKETGFAEQIQRQKLIASLPSTFDVVFLILLDLKPHNQVPGCFGARDALHVGQMVLRRFTYGNLAQLKYIMPEAIVINKILLRDEKTCCMKPDLQVNLLVDAVEGSVMQKGETRYSALRRMFRQRVVDFFRNHPEGDDIPEHELPHPFTQTKPTVPQITPRVGVPEAESAVPSSSLAGLPPVGMSHMPGSFKRMFSKRSATCPATASTTSPLAKAESMSSSPLRKKIGASEGTPAKFASTPVRLMAATPGLHTPKQPVPATLCDTPPLTTTKRSARAKLFMTPTKSASSTTEEEENQITSTSAVEYGDDELLSFLPKSLLQSVKQKEKRALEEKETGFAEQIQRQKLIASLPSTFDVVFLIYQSRKRSVLNKQELVDKIMESNPKIVDKGEIEEQLRLLQEFVPEWISEKTGLSGDVLCRVDTALRQSEIRQRLQGVE